MKNIEVIQVLQRTGKKIFTLAEIKRILDIKQDNTAYKKVESLIKDKILTRTIKGIYYLNLNPPSDFELANVLYKPSYLSLFSALNFYGVLVQSPYEITSVTPRLSKKINVSDKTFHYFHISKDYYFGYQTENDFLIANPEKSLLDTLFFMCLGRVSIDYDELSLKGNINQGKFKALSEKIKHPAFKNLVKQLKL